MYDKKLLNSNKHGSVSRNDQKKIKENECLIVLAGFNMKLSLKLVFFLKAGVKLAVKMNK